MKAKGPYKERGKTKNSSVVIEEKDMWQNNKYN